MKRIVSLSFVLLLVLAIAIVSQGQGRGGGRGAAAPPAPAPLQAVADAIAAAINSQNSAALTKMLTMDALYLDEDGHAIPASVWATMRLTGTPGKMFTIDSSHGGMLDDNSAWLSFNYKLSETFQGAPKNITGTVSIALKKSGTDWTIAMIHGAMTQKVAGITQ
jgi:hypothetical protein